MAVLLVAFSLILFDDKSISISPGAHLSSFLVTQFAALPLPHHKTESFIIAPCSACFLFYLFLSVFSVITKFS